MLNGVVILKRLMKLPKWLISQKRGVVVVIRSTNTSLAHSHFFLLHSLTLSLSRSLCLCRCLQVSAHVKPNDYNLLRDYEVSCILYIQFYAVKRCLINYTAVALALAALKQQRKNKNKNWLSDNVRVPCFSVCSEELYACLSLENQSTGSNKLNDKCDSFAKTSFSIA